MTRLRLVSLVVAVGVVHLAVLPDLRVAGIRADGFVVLTMAMAVVGGPERGAVTGFACGLVADLFLQSPFGLSALAYGVAGFAVGLLEQAVIRAAWWIPVATAFLGGVATTVLFALSAAVIGRPDYVQPRLGAIAVVVGAFAAVTVLPLLRAVRWALQADRPRSYAG